MKSFWIEKLLKVLCSVSLVAVLTGHSHGKELSIMEKMLGFWERNHLSYKMTVMA